MKKPASPLTRELRRLMKRYKLSQTAVARLTGCARNTPHYWLKENPVIPEHRLRVLKFELDSFTAQ